MDGLISAVRVLSAGVSHLLRDVVAERRHADLHG